MTSQTTLHRCFQARSSDRVPIRTPRLGNTYLQKERERERDQQTAQGHPAISDVLPKLLGRFSAEERFMKKETSYIGLPTIYQENTPISNNIKNTDRSSE